MIRYRQPPHLLKLNDLSSEDEVLLRVRDGQRYEFRVIDTLTSTLRTKHKDDLIQDYLWRLL